MLVRPAYELAPSASILLEQEQGLRVTLTGRTVTVWFATLPVDHRHGSHSELVVLEQGAEKTRAPPVEGAESGEELGS